MIHGEKRARGNARIKDEKTQLAAFNISHTPAHEMERKWGMKKAEMLERHILFQADGAEKYIGGLIGGSSDSPESFQALQPRPRSEGIN